MDAAMEQRDSIVDHDLAALESAARALQAHPHFDRALEAFCDGLVGFHVGRPLANLGLGYTLGWAVATLVVYLDHALPAGTTSARLIALCTAGGLAGPKAVKGAIGVLMHFGLIAEAPHVGDRRAKRLRPTDLLLEIQADNVAARLVPLEILGALPGPAQEWGRRRAVVLAYLGGSVEAFARSRFRLYDGYPEIRAFMDRASGYPILLFMLRGIRPAGGGALVATVSPSAISARFDVSRAHVRKLLGVGRQHGWLSVTANGDQIFFEAGFHGRLRQWIALEFAWARRLVATNPVLCEGMA